MDIVEQLHRSVDTRPTPEAVCALILQALDHRLLPTERRLVARAAGSPAAAYSSMSDDFERPVPALHKVAVLGELLMGKELTDDVVSQLAGDPWVLIGQLETIRVGLGWSPDERWLTPKDFKARGGGLSRRRYNRLRRHLTRTYNRARRLQDQILLRQLTLVARSGLAYTITLDEMRGDVDAACFVAYWVAQRNRRRAFTPDGRDNPFDTIAQMLLERCQRRVGATDWWMVARAYPDPAVLALLDDERRGALLAEWYGFMHMGAAMLKELYAAWPSVTEEPKVPASAWAARPGLMPAHVANPPVRKAVDLKTMIVRPGVDMSTWNTVAGAYNAARAGWINCLGAAGALDLLEAVCPGKAMRLIAADLAAMHYLNGGEPDRQTLVWASLPLPWQVLSGDEQCDVYEVERVCESEAVDPHATGWTAPRQHAGDVAEWKPTAELVHGIEVNDPLWARLLRRHGYFSGGPVKPLTDGAPSVTSPY